MRRKRYIYFLCMISIVIFFIDKFLLSLNNSILYMVLGLIYIIAFILILTDKKKINTMKKIWAGWKTFQKIIAVLIIFINVYVLGQMNIFSDIITAIVYIGANVTICYLGLKPER